MLAHVCSVYVRGGQRQMLGIPPIFLPPSFEASFFYIELGAHPLAKLLVDQRALRTHSSPKTGVSSMKHYSLFLCRCWDWMPVLMLAWESLFPVSHASHLYCVISSLVFSWVALSLPFFFFTVRFGTQEISAMYKWEIGPG